MQEFDVAIIGAGPAGISAGIWCAELGLKPIIFESSPSPGGQLNWIHNAIADYPGLSAANGSELFQAFQRSLRNFRIEVSVDDRVCAVEPGDGTIRTERGSACRARFVVLATGVRRRRLNVPGETELAGKGVLVSGSRDRREVSGKRVAIVGGGDAALENALILSEFASKVYVIHRRKAFSARSEFVEKVAAKHNVETLYSTTILAINGSERLDSVTTLETDREESRELAVDALLIRIGVEPNSELIAGQVETDERGYITVDRTGRTSLKRVYAVGDVANPVAPTIATSVGTGAAAAKAIAAAIRALS